MTTQEDMALLGGGFNQRTVQRGIALQRGHAVIEVMHDPDEYLLEALVQGSRSTPYQVTIFLGTRGEIEETDCSCPMAIDCKHAVATFLQHRAQIRSGDRALPVPGGQPTRSASKAPAPAPDRLGEWLRRFDAAGHARGGRAAAAPAHPAHGSGPRQRLYVLEPLQGRGAAVRDVLPGASLSLREATRGSTGRYNKGRRYNPNDYGYGYHVGRDTVTDALDDEIASCGAALASRAGGGSTHGWHANDGCYALRGRLGATMLELAIETGRAFVGNDRHRPLEPGPTLPLEPDWQEDDAGAHALRLRAGELEHWWALPTDPPMYLDPDAHRAGRLSTDMSGAQLLIALETPAVPEKELQRFGEALEAFGGVGTARLLPPPVELDERRIHVPPVPVLLLHSLDDDPHVDSWVVELVARYEEVVFPCDPWLQKANVRVEHPQGGRVRVQRDPHAERERHVELVTRFPALLPHRTEDGIAFRADGETPAARFRVYRELVASREALETGGWELIVSPPVHTDTVRPSSFQALIERDPGEPGWFDVSLGFEHAGVHHELMPLVIAWLERGRGDEPVLIEQEDGRFLEVPAAALEPVAAVFDELGSRVGGQDTIRLSRARALALERLEQALGEADIETDWQGDREPVDFARRLRTLADIDTTDFADTPVPRALRATLRPYQRAGLGWLNALAKHGLCGILADDMGLGKTVQTLAHLLWLRSARRLDGPALVVAPTSLLGNWAREAAQFAPRLNVRVWHGIDRHAQPLHEGQPAADLVITSYGLALRDRDLLAEHGFALLVLDEAQQIRNPVAKITRAVKSLPIERRLCLSGTPLENHLGELWSQFDFLMPGLLGDAKRFTRHYRTPIEKHGNDERRVRLAEAVRPFLLRRRKEAVATELPAKTEIVREVILGGRQAKLYESIRIAMQERVRDALQRRGVAQSQITVLDSLLKLRQLCCHPGIVKLPSARKVEESAKTDMLLDMLTEMIAEGRRVLVFSQFTSMLSLIERELAARDIAWVKLTGQTRRRDEAIDRFQRGEVPLFLISLKAGGTGLNLTAADTVIHYDPWWNPAAEDQASARAHRIGQDKPVFVYRLVTTGTVEERIVALQARKRQLADGVLERSDAGALASMSAQETLSLFDAV